MAATKRAISSVVNATKLKGPKVANPKALPGGTRKKLSPPKAPKLRVGYR
jgi:hypothetical protein